MTRRSIQLETRTILFSSDDPVPLGGRVQALVKLRVTDELNGGPPESLLILDASRRGVIPRVATDGLAGLVGIPQDVFPALKTQDYFVHLTVRADGYVSRSEEIKIPQNPSFPATFVPSQLALSLHREPLTILGRTTRFVSNTSTALGGAEVRVTGIWRTPPPANAMIPPDPPNLVSIRPTLYSDRTAVTHNLRRRNLLPVAGTDKALLDDVLRGANPIRLSDRQGLISGDILLVDSGQPDLGEFIAVKTVPVSNPADQPTPITLDYPVRYRHRRGAIVQKVNPQPLGPPRQIGVNAIVGDACLFLNNLAGLTAAHEVQITGAGAADEYHELKLFSVTSDADGYYRLPPLSRVAQVEIHAEKTVGAQTFKTIVTFRPDYRERENRLDLALAL